MKWRLLLCGGVGLFWDAGLSAQQARKDTISGGGCQVELDNVDRNGVTVETVPGVKNHFAGGHVRMHCRGQKVFMSSDSVASYQGNVFQWIGTVKYRDTSVTMEADFGTYYKDGERWEWRGNVHYTNLKNRSKLQGPSVDYYRKVVRIRDTTEVYAVQRPTIEYAVDDSVGKPAEPYIIIGDRVRMKGNDRVWAGGTVTIDRSDLLGRGDSLFLDTGKGNKGSLINHASMRRVASDSFTLTGERINLRLWQKELNYVAALGNGHLVNGTLDMVGDTIGLDIEAKKLQRTIAWGKKVRPHAHSADYDIDADSLVFDTPDQALREARAFRRAWLGTKPDSATGKRDWMSGDTVVARFEQHDSAGTKRTALKQLEARTGAKSFYRIADGKAKSDEKTKPAVDSMKALVPPDSVKKPSINYTRADFILVTMLSGDSTGVETVFSRGKVDGIHVQPAAPKKAKTDSTKADSVRTRKTP